MVLLGLFVVDLALPAASTGRPARGRARGLVRGGPSACCPSPGGCSHTRHLARTCCAWSSRHVCRELHVCRASCWGECHLPPAEAALARACCELHVCWWCRPSGGVLPLAAFPDSPEGPGAYQADRGCAADASRLPSRTGPWAAVGTRLPLRRSRSTCLMTLGVRCTRPSSPHLRRHNRSTCPVTLQSRCTPPHLHLLKRCRRSACPCTPSAPSKLHPLHLLKLCRRDRSTCPSATLVRARHTPLRCLGASGEEDARSQHFEN